MIELIRLWTIALDSLLLLLISNARALLLGSSIEHNILQIGPDYPKHANRNYRYDDGEAMLVLRCIVSSASSLASTRIFRSMLIISIEHVNDLLKELTAHDPSRIRRHDQNRHCNRSLACTSRIQSHP